MSDDRTFRHLLLTRFNVRMKWLDEARGVSDEWLEHRVALFERFCLPSVRAQTCQDFTWLVFMDASTPGQWKERIESHARTYSNLVPRYVELFDWFALRAAMEEVVPPRADVDLITTRLDNDDSLARTMMERVQSCWSIDGARPRLIAFERGLFFRRDKVYDTLYPNNPFSSVIESSIKPKTALHFDHIEAGQHLDVESLRGDPAWMIVVHDRNVLNRVRGRRCSVSVLADHVAIESMPRGERAIELAAGRLTSGLFWRAWRVINALRRVFRGK